MLNLCNKPLVYFKYNLVFIFLLVISPVTAAQEVTLPTNDGKDAFKSPQRQRMMMPKVEEVTRLRMETHLDFLSEHNTSKTLAKFTRNFYEALIDEGFSKEEALDIITKSDISRLTMKY